MGEIVGSSYGTAGTGSRADKFKKTHLENMKTPFGEKEKIAKN